MNRAKILLSAVMLSSLVGLVQADEGELGVTLDTTFVSKYIWHGFNFYGHDDSAVQPSVDVDLWGTGFGVTFWSSWATNSGTRNLEEYDYILYYGNNVFEDTPYATNYTFNWLYYDFYDTATHGSDLQELMAQFSWPDLLPCDIVPSYTVGKLWQASSGSAALKNIGGWVHVLGLGYDWAMPGILPDTPEQVVSLMADLTYNDGYGATGADHDWSHATVGASTSFEVAENLNFTPAVYYQISMDDSVNRDDEVWTRLSLTCGF
jgi:hypothetical protein